MNAAICVLADRLHCLEQQRDQHHRHDQRNSLRFEGQPLGLPLDRPGRALPALQRDLRRQLGDHLGGADQCEGGDQAGRIGMTDGRDDHRPHGDGQAHRQIFAPGELR